MERVKRDRAVLRAKLTRLVNQTTPLLSQPEPDKDVLQVKLQILQSLSNGLDEADTKVRDQMLDENATEAAMEAEQQSIDQYEEERLMLKVKLMKILEPPVLAALSEITGSHHGGGGTKRTIQLPKIPLMKFNGQYQGWLTWWAQYRKIHEDPEMDESSKSHYLLDAMADEEARKLMLLYLQTTDNYQEAVEALKERYGREDLQQQYYVSQLLKLVITNVSSKEKLPLSTLYLEIESHLRCLATLDLSNADPKTWLYPMVESSLSSETQWAWRRSSLSKEDGRNLIPPKSRLDYLMEFIKTEVRTEQQINMAQSAFQSSSIGESSRNRNKQKTQSVKKTEDYATAAGLISGENSCGFCNGKHDTDRCGRAQDMKHEDKIAKLKEKGLCFSCLSPFHGKKKCPVYVKCLICGKHHHSLMCREESSGKKKEQRSLSGSTERAKGEDNKTISENVSTSASTANLCSSEVLLNILHVNVLGSRGTMKVRMVGDSGCQKSYIRSGLVKKLGLRVDGHEYVQNILFGNIATAPVLHKRITVPLSSLGGENTDEQILLEKPQICGSLTKVPYGPWIAELRQRGIEIADVGKGHEEVDILLGSDKWNSILIKDEKEQVISYMTKCGLLAVKTIFGWTLSGPVPAVSSNMAVVVTSSMLSGSSDLSHLWSLEAIGIKDPIEIISKEEEEKAALDHFRDHVSRDAEGRYIVGLPWKGAEKLLPTNRNVAEKRLIRATNVLKKMDKFQVYDAVFQGWEREGIIKEVRNDYEEGHFLPHRPVFKESTTTPVRPVFDASCKVGKSPSLNDCMHKGPNLLELIPSLLIRFREKPIGVSADIRKAFQMIRVREEDQKFQKFLWWTDETCSTVKVYQHQRVVFGMNCSPFLLAATINHHLEMSKEEAETCDSPFDPIGNVLFYVDNLVNSVCTDDEYKKLRAKSTTIMNDAGMELRQWACTIGESQEAQEEVEVIISMLGLIWNRKTDELACVIPEIEPDEKFTKKKVLSLVARVFDPIGFLSPALVPLKTIIQESWASDLGWDELLPDEIQAKIEKWIKVVSMLSQVKVPRHFQLPGFTRRECHIFVDASCAAYAGAVFVRTEVMGAVAVQLVLAKSRLAPRKKTKGISTAPTIPRLELMACLIGTRLASTVRVALGFKEGAEFFWSDSTTALAWIRRHDQWGTFVGNRVEEIRRTTSTTQWRHVPGLMNPADLPSRGCGPKELLDSSWWEGPAWLREEKETWPSNTEEIDEESVAEEMKRTAVMISSSVEPPRFSSYQKNIAVVGWRLRFVHNARVRVLQRKKVPTELAVISSPYLTIGEMRKAEIGIIRLVQQEAFPKPANRIGGMMVTKDEEGLLRVQTRLTHRKDAKDFIHPILLPKKHPMVDQLILNIHRYSNHAGVQILMSKTREKYWILQTRRTIKRVLRSCVTCRRFQAKPGEVIPSSLPKGRVEEGEPFQVTGVDLFGPMILKDGSKVWGVIFTCAFYRGVHLDLVCALSTEAFIGALERFISIYGRPNTIYSDNGTNFHGTNNVFKMLDWNEIEAKSNVKQIQWIFNPPSAAWWGGFWERLIRSVKDLLKRILGTSKLDYEELRTCLSGVCGTINERPLTVVTEDGEDLQPLTPAMFLKRNVGAVLPETVDATFLQKGYLRMKVLQQQLQERFRKEYLSLLVQRGETPKKEQLAEGAVVLVGAENKKRFQWPLGLIVELIPGKDGNCRVARVKTEKGILERPLQRLYPLEVSCQDVGALKQIRRGTESGPGKKTPGNVGEEVKTSPQRVVVTKRGRVIRTPARYGAWMHLDK